MTITAKRRSQACFIFHHPNMGSIAAVSAATMILYISPALASSLNSTYQFWDASSPLCWFNNKEFLCITHIVEHNYISPSSAVGIQLHVSALYVGHIQVVI